MYSSLFRKSDREAVGPGRIDQPDGPQGAGLWAAGRDQHRQNLKWENHTNMGVYRAAMCVSA